MKDAYPITTPMVPGLKLSSKCREPKDDDEAHLLAKLPYRALVGTLNYIALGTRPDIVFAVQQLSQGLNSYTFAHWEAAKRVLRYLKGTRELKLHLSGRKPAQLIGFTDADYANCPDTRRSVSGYCFSLGSGMVSWATRKQKTVSLSSCEAEYIAAAEACKESTWLHSLDALGFCQLSPTPLLCDNQSSITLAGDPSFHARVKHIDIKYHYIRECIELGELHIH